MRILSNLALTVLVLGFVGCNQSGDYGKVPNIKDNVVSPVGGPLQNPSKAPSPQGGTEFPQQGAHAPAATTGAPEVQTSTQPEFDYAKRLGAVTNPEKELPGLIINSNRAIKLPDQKFLPTVEQIDELFKLVVGGYGAVGLATDKANSTSSITGNVHDDNLRQLGIAKANYKKYVDNMISFGEALLKLVRNPDFYTTYNVAMYHYYLSLWSSSCQIWSGDKDPKNCPLQESARNERRNYHYKEFSNLKPQYQEDLLKVQPVEPQLEAKK